MRSLLSLLLLFLSGCSITITMREVRISRLGPSPSDVSLTINVADTTELATVKTALLHSGTIAKLADGSEYRFSTTATAGGIAGLGGGRWWLLAASGVGVSVKTFGAVGDGAADDTASIQAAINAVIAQPGVGIVYIPKGAYKVTDSLTFGPGGAAGSLAVPLTVKGDGQGTQIINAAGANKATFTPRGVSYWKLCDLLLTGNSATPNHGIHISKNGNGQSCIGWELNNVICQMAGKGFVLEDTNTGIIRNCMSWPSGNTAALTVAQVVAPADISHHVHLTGSFANDILIIGGQYQPQGAYAAGQSGIKVDATIANNINVFGALLEGDGTADRFGLHMTGTNGYKISGIFADNANIYLTGCYGGSLENIRNGGAGTFTLDACVRAHAKDITFPVGVISGGTTGKLDSVDFFTSIAGASTGIITHRSYAGGVRIADRGNYPVTFKARNGAFVVGAGLSVVALFGVVAFDPFAVYTAATGKFKPGIAGKYRLTTWFTATGVATGTSLIIEVFKNGVLNDNDVRGVKFVAGDVSNFLSTIVDSDEDDEFTVVVTNTDGANAATLNPMTFCAEAL